MMSKKDIFSGVVQSVFRTGVYCGAILLLVVLVTPMSVVGGLKLLGTLCIGAAVSAFTRLYQPEYTE